jgi:hypothetical protein
MWMLQATFITMRWGLFSLRTGRQEVNSDTKRKEEIKQASERERATKRETPRNSRSSCPMGQIFRCPPSAKGKMKNI